MTTPPPPPPPTVPEYLQDDDLTDECRDLLSTLPTERGWITKHLYHYQGFWVGPRQVQGLLACQKHFQALDSDTILVSYPKSGTTWLKAMAFALLNRSRFLDLHHHPLLTNNPHDLVPFLELALYYGKELPDLSAYTSPRLFGTHSPVGSLPRSVKDSSCKIVNVCRNPLDMFVSMWHFYNKLRPQGRGAKKLEDVFDSFCNGVSLYGPFWDHVMGYWKESLKNPQKVLLMKYEEIKEHPTTQLKRLAHFLECPFSLEEDAQGVVDDILRLCSFDNLSKLEVNKTSRLATSHLNKTFFRKGEIGSWENILTPKMVEKLNDIVEKKMHNFDFKF